MNTTDCLPDILLSKREVLRVTGVSAETLRRWAHEGRFPRRVRSNPHGRAGGWLKSEVEAWLRERAAARDAVFRNEGEKRTAERHIARAAARRT